jgi:cytochrome P450
MAERRLRPGDDALSELLAPAADGSNLSQFEVVTMARGLLTAGNGTTRALLGSGTRCLALHPKQWSALQANPELAGATVEEALRYESPIQGFFRTATRTVRLSGVDIPTGARVFVLYAAANRDESRFREASAFRIDRDATGHKAFGAGPHFCLGSGLARLQGRLLFGAMARKLRAIEISGPVALHATPVSRGVARLPLRLSAK